MRRAQNIGTVAGWALLTFAALYIGAHVLYALGIDPIRAAMAALGFGLGVFVLVALFLSRRPAA